MDATVKILNNNLRSLEEWKHYYELLRHKGIYHSPEYIKAFEDHYQSSAELFLFKVDNDNFIYYPYFKRSLKYLPFDKSCRYDFVNSYDIVSSWYYGGPLVHFHNRENIDKLVSSFHTAFSQYCRESRIVSEFIRFDPNLENHSYFENVLPMVSNRQTVYVNLMQSVEDIWNNFQGRARTAIRKAQKMGINVRVSDKCPEDIESFYKIYNAEMERKRAPSHYRFNLAFFQNLIDEISDNIELVYAELDGAMFSSGLFVYDNKHHIAHYFLMATQNEYQQYQANNLILYETMLHFKNRNFSTFDLQGGREGVYKFKTSFSKKERATFFTSGIIHDVPAYDELVECTKLVSDIHNENFFPLYRLKNTN
jgi:lipid II:glycine glycyltransferase (peptidoglycan interpeptide bridge formation enzyme)